MESFKMFSMKSSKKALPKLVLYSGGQEPGNSELHRALVDLATTARMRRDRKQPMTMTYVPFCSEGSQTYFYRAIRRYAPLGVIDFLCLDLEQDPTRAQIREALRSDIVYLAGGNTFFFLHQIQRLNMLPLLREYVRKGGVLAGLSAGALIMTPTISLAGVPGLDPDENDISLKNPKALGVVPFEFSPHFVPSKIKIQRHLAYSRKVDRVIYASQDGGGIIVQGRAISFVGPTWAFFRGALVKVQN
jgi:dipeptidase E